MYDIIWLIMRRMRTPLILLIVIYAVSVSGMVLIPGQTPMGEPFRMTFLDASYFVAFMSTTIGFGEIPYEFTEAQRLWTFSIIFFNVGGWIYAIGSILALIGDSQFQQALTLNKFARKVRNLKEPFYLVCGYGSTGSLLVQGLRQRRLQAVVIERDEDAVKRIVLRHDFGVLPAIDGDARNRELLELAGLGHSCCRGVMAVTDDNEANLAIAITSRLLYPERNVFARSETARVGANMASFGTDYIIDPYEVFTRRLALVLNSPAKFLVQDWLISVPGTPLREPVYPPKGSWIVCGLGRFGSHVVEMLDTSGIKYIAVDTREALLQGHANHVVGRGTEAHTLLEAGIQEAAGIVACTANDVDNLSIVMTALELNSRLFTVARQDNRDNDLLFEASRADLIARRSHIVARRMLTIATTPLMDPFLAQLHAASDDWAYRVMKRLENTLRGRAPNLWLLDFGAEGKEAIRTCRRYQCKVTLGAIRHNTRIETDELLSAECLVIEQANGELIFIPDDDTEIGIGDKLLFAGRSTARDEMLSSLQDPHRLLNFVSGISLPRGSFWRWWHARRAEKSKASKKAA